MYRLGIMAKLDWGFRIISKTLVQGPHSRSAEGCPGNLPEGHLDDSMGAFTSGLLLAGVVSNPHTNSLCMLFFG